MEKFTSLHDSGYRYIELKGLSQYFFLENRKNYLRRLKAMLSGLELNSIIVLQGGKEIPKYDTDVVNFHFQQEANFYYLTGVMQPDCYAIFDLQNEDITIFVNLSKNERDLIYMHIPTIDELSEKYTLTFKDFDQIYSYINSRDPKKIYLLNGINSDSGNNIQTATLEFPRPMEELQKRVDNNNLIYEILADTRSKKSKYESDLISYICKATVEGHKEVMKQIKPKMNERDVENIFFNYMRSNYYTRIWAYPCICPCGPNSATLHYDINDNSLDDGSLLLFDCGIRIGGYCSDVTSTIPVNGKFTDKQKNIYQIVLDSNRSVINELKPGVYWPDMHILAEKCILKGLIKLKLLNEFPLEEMISNRVAYYFMPHGLGHFMGIEVHDVGGYLSFTPDRSSEIGLKSLRTARYLTEGNVITVEPGIYFIPYLLEKAFNDELIKKYFNIDIIKEYYNFGGIRIEDDILITIDGNINMTKDIPRTIEDIENLMKK